MMMMTMMMMTEYQNFIEIGLVITPFQRNVEASKDLGMARGRVDSLSVGSSLVYWLRIGLIDDNHIFQAITLTLYIFVQSAVLNICQCECKF